jgi:transcriptional regulator with XRE-family HTH domain
VTGPWNTQARLGAFIRNRRKLARLTLRQLAETTSVSNAYLSQLERGLHLPSVRVLKLLSEALNVSAETLLAQAGLLDLAPSGDEAGTADAPPASPVESAISADERLADEQKAALIAVYRSMLRSWRTSSPLPRYLSEPRLRGTDHPSHQRDTLPMTAAIGVVGEPLRSVACVWRSWRMPIQAAQ